MTSSINVRSFFCENFFFFNSFKFFKYNILIYMIQSYNKEPGAINSNR